MNILGIHIGHDSAAAVVVDGRIVADVAEERFTRIKHYCGLPYRSVGYCLNQANLTFHDIDVIAVPTSGPLSGLKYLFNGHLGREERSVPGRILEAIKKILNHSTRKLPLYKRGYPLGAQTDIMHFDHHKAHAASAYYTSGVADRQLVVTMDGAGDGASVCLWRGENGKLSLLKRFPTSASLGWFYGNVTEALGWWHGDGEGKTMGLAPYGDYTPMKGQLDRFYPKFVGGELVEPHNFGRAFYWNEGEALHWHFDEASEILCLIEKFGKECVAAEAQRVLEEQVKELIFPWLERERTHNLSCAGGLFLNVKLNQRVWESGEIELHHIFPNAGDSGVAAGAALCAYYELNPGSKIWKIEDLYLGPSYSNEEIANILKERNLPHQFREDVEEYTAKLLAADNIVGFLQGRMESGPRALGNRSILMSANRKENKDIINARVKFREPFRPFCPSLLYEKRKDYLLHSREESFMITSFNVTDQRRDKVPAVVHVDGTLRPQTVRKQVNQRYWKLINEFGKLTGEFLLLNTSFNIMGEPIVCNPKEAIRCFYDSGIDALVLGDYVLEKPSLRK